MKISFSAENSTTSSKKRSLSKSKSDDASSTSLSVFNNPTNGEPSERKKVKSSPFAHFAKRRRARKKQAEILATDPLAFSYDEVYDEMKSKESTKVLAKRKEAKSRPSRIIGKMLEARKERDTRMELVKSRQMAEERHRTHEIYGDKSSFVTGKYKDHLREIDKQSAKDSRREDASVTAATEGSMHSFYSRVLKLKTSGGTHLQSAIGTVETDSSDSHNSVKRESCESEDESGDDSSQKKDSNVLVSKSADTGVIKVESDESVRKLVTDSKSTDSDTDESKDKTDFGKSAVAKRRIAKDLTQLKERYLARKLMRETLRAN